MEFVEDNNKKENLYTDIVKEFINDNTVTQNNKDNLTNLIDGLSNSVLRKTLHSMLNHIQISQKDNTVEYYLNDLQDKNRFRTAWM
jgi:hypothetical protein